jgi:hypothetical protein
VLFELRTVSDGDQKIISAALEKILK